MVASIVEEVKEMYGKRRSALKEKAASLREDINTNIDLKKNESYKEVESK